MHAAGTAAVVATNSLIYSLWKAKKQGQHRTATRRVTFQVNASTAKSNVGGITAHAASIFLRRSTRARCILVSQGSHIIQERLYREPLRQKQDLGDYSSYVQAACLVFSNMKCVNISVQISTTLRLTTSCHPVLQGSGLLRLRGFKLSNLSARASEIRHTYGVRSYRTTITTLTCARWPLEDCVSLVSTRGGSTQLRWALISTQR
ncbi:hypothetical protein Micbo1qcDRAFT_161255 [Microdochium bolleyi]|uniref:Uncharacterized protein n=1 Tax=Microdochium bolleyi TaxID=196109 RepID=A0A136J7X3_9PEZI|nr:hypothetical protein Micbo1qcDRAFT_161255 [Microdochium bolleyi]